MSIATFGKNLKRIRTELGMSQTALAKVLHTSQQHISRLELGQVEPTINIAFAIVRKLNISWEELLDGVE